MDEEIKFSVLLPTFNSMAFIKPCIESILNQSYQNLILQIFDGGSTDETLQYMESIKDERVVIYHSPKQLTIEENWHRFLSIKKETYMTIIGHDDIYAADYLSEISLLINEQPDASLYQTHFNYINKDGLIVRNCQKMPSRILPNQFLKDILTGGVDIMATGFMMRSHDYEKIGGIPLFPKLLFADDALWLQLVQKKYIAVSSKVCFSFRYHQNTSNVLLGEATFYSLGFYTNFLEKNKIEYHESACIIEDFGAKYIFARCKEIVIRMIRKPLNERNNFRVTDIINGCIKYANLLSPNNSINPLTDKTILIAKFIDSNWLSRSCFVLFKRFFKSPIVK